jgi:hypothetical protein
MSKRQDVQNYIIKYIDKIVPGGENKQLYVDLFASMDDKQFEVFIEQLSSGEKKLAVITPNFSKNSISIQRNFDVAKELGHDFFKRIWVPQKGNVPSYLTPIKYLVVDLPIRRQAQLLDKKISVPEDNNSVDNMTGQPTGKSKGSRMSYPEIQVLAALNMEVALTELLKYRGGDQKGFNAMNTMISRTGKVSLKAIEPFSSGVKSTQSLSAMLNGMHLKNTI